SRLKQVVLPAPLGPMRAWMLPRRTFKETLLTATKPLNSFVNPRVSRIVSVTQPLPAAAPHHSSRHAAGNERQVAPGGRGIYGEDPLGGKARQVMRAAGLRARAGKS